jgi:hypothetical protein
MTASGTINIQTGWRLLDQSESISTPQDVQNLKASLALASGTSAGQIDGVYRQTVSVGAGATVSLDLKNLVDSLNEALDFAKVLGIVCYNKSVTDRMSLGGNAAGLAFVNPVTAQVEMGLSIAPNATPLLLVDPEGYDVVVTTGDQLDINSLGATGGDVDILIWGQKA